MITLNPTKLISIPLNYTDPATKESFNLIGYWTRLSWLEHNRIYARSIRNDSLDSVLYRDGKLKTCLKRLEEVHEGKTENIEINDTIIDNLPVSLASNLIASFEKYFEPSEEDLKHLEEVSYDFFKGRQIDGAVPQYLYEHVIARHYSWGLKEIRGMDNYDFQSHLRICLIRESLDAEWQAKLSGATQRGSRSAKGAGRETVDKKFDPIKGDFVS